MTRLISTAAFDLAALPACCNAAAAHGWQLLELDRNDLAARCESPTERASLESELRRTAAAAGLTIAAAATTADFATEDGCEQTLRDWRALRDSGVGQLAVAFGSESEAAIFAGRHLEAARLDRFRRAADWAATAGLVVGLETGSPYANDYRTMLRTLAAVDHPGWRINFDAGRYQWFNIESVVESALQRVLHRLSAIRLTDFDIGVYNAGGSLDRSRPPRYRPLGQGGTLDLGRWRQMVDGAGFAGPWCISFTPGRWPRFESDLSASQRVLRDARWLPAATI